VTETRFPLDHAPQAGEVRMLDVGGHRVGLYRVGDELHALADRCPHRGAPLCSSGRAVRGVTLDDGLPTQGAAPASVRCPWHRWDFDIATGRCLVHPRLRVRRYRVEVDGDEVVVSLRHPAGAPPRPPG
jgi:3-phenylpropionate/trans-cinnamate dioxygenase ferredoxin subunit